MGHPSTFIKRNETWAETQKRYYEEYLKKLKKLIAAGKGKLPAGFIPIVPSPAIAVQVKTTLVAVPLASTAKVAARSGPSQAYIDYVAAEEAKLMKDSVNQVDTSGATAHGVDPRNAEQAKARK